MHITDIREKSVPMGAAMRNAVIDFSKMTVSAVAVVTDVVRDGKPVVGFGFNSNGRYAQGEIIRTRLAPRIFELTPEQQQNQAGDNLDPISLRSAMLRNEKPGGHGERAIAVAAVEIALWDAAAKIAEVPLWQMLGGEDAENRIFVYAAGGYYDEEKGIPGLLEEVRGYLASGYTWVKIKIGGATLEEDIRRIEAVLELLGGDGGIDGVNRFVEGLSGRSSSALGDLGLLAPLGFAFAVGMASAVNPCGFAMLPAYLGLYLGKGKGEGNVSPVKQLYQAIVVGGAVTCGFLVLFGGLFGLGDFLIHGFDVFAVEGESLQFEHIAAVVAQSKGDFDALGQVVQLFLGETCAGVDDDGGGDTGHATGFFF